jgi:preprotein translocase SecF subunit
MATTNFKFMKYGKLSYVISVVLFVISIVSFFTRGLNYGIDFTGGVLMEVQPKTQVELDVIRKDLAVFKPELQKDSKSGTIMVRVGLEKGATNEQQNAKVAEIKHILGDNYEYRQIQVVGPRIGAELIRAGLLAIVFSFLGMAIYIWIRYSGGYAFGSLVSLVIDFFLMFGFFSVTGLEFNQNAIAVILLGIGYSVNDKVVNYDRIMENSIKYHKMSNTDLIDLSVNEMLSRTIMTSLSTMLAMIALCIWGGEVLREFSYAMMFCIVLGTATSIWVSNALLQGFDIRTRQH